MRRFIPLAVTATGLALPFSPLHASGDYGCAPSWEVASRNYDECGGRAILSPGNDTRVNLFYLLRDVQRVPAGALAYPKSDDDASFGHTFFGWGLLRQAYYPQENTDQEQDQNYGSRCISLSSGTDAFVAAMQANRGLPAAERERLTQARGTIAAHCANGGAMAGPSLVAPEVKSGPGREYLGYLQSADAFYAEQWDAARDGFARLRKSKDPWLSETASYMLARTELNAAQNTAFDGYGAFDARQVDNAMLAKARAGFEDYLKRYGQGRYANSARGLVRRTLWLAGDAVALSREYERLLGAVAVGSPGAADLVQEIDSKFLFASSGEIVGNKAADGPMLLATVDLMMMRDPGEGGMPVISAEEIAAQESRFAGRADLFGFVQASHAYYVAKDMRRVLQLIPDDAKRPSYAPLAFSRQVLRGLALAALKDRNESGFWRELMGGASALYQRPLIELALAMNYERAGKLADVFAPGSPIGEVPVREILLQNVAGPDLLRTAARSTARPQHERDVALFTLLHKELLFGDYAGFLRDVALVPTGALDDSGLWSLREQEKIPVGLFRAGASSDGYDCPALAVSAQALARNPRDFKPRLCLGDFYRSYGFDNLGVAAGTPKPDELGGTPTLFPGKPTPRGEIYDDIIRDPKAPAADKAYALYRAINCYAPSGNNECGNADVPQSQRRAWFQQLKRDYGSSSWAQTLRYYW
jgi:hypothetical protein